MSEETGSKSNPIDATVVMIDVVGFSKLIMQDQLEVVTKLSQLVREILNLEEIKTPVSDKTKVLLLPRGDGWGICFFAPDQLTKAMKYAVMLNQRSDAIKIRRNGKELPSGIRIGVNKGLLHIYSDQSKGTDVEVAGVAINQAERVMSVGDAGHIFCKVDIADYLLRDGDLGPLIPRKNDGYQNRFRIQLKEGEDMIVVQGIHGKYQGLEVGNENIPNKITLLAQKVATFHRKLKFSAREMGRFLGISKENDDYIGELYAHFLEYGLSETPLDADINVTRTPFSRL